MGARSRVRPPAPRALRRRRCVRPASEFVWSMNCDELRGAEELLQRGDDRADVDDRLRRDRVLVLGREALADDALHPVEADAEGLLDELADGAQAAVAEVLVLVEVVGDRLARQRDGLGGVVLDLDLAVLGHAEQLAAGRRARWTSAWMSSCVSVRVSRSMSRPRRELSL